MVPLQGALLQGVFVQLGDGMLEFCGINPQRRDMLMEQFPGTGVQTRTARQRQVMGGVQSGTIKAEALDRSEEHTSELQSRPHLVCRLLLEKKKKKKKKNKKHK